MFNWQVWRCISMVRNRAVRANEPILFSRVFSPQSRMKKFSFWPYNKSLHDLACSSKWLNIGLVMPISSHILLFCWNKNPQALKFKLKSLNFIMLYKQDNSGKKIYRRKLYSGKFTKWNNFKSGRSNLARAGENSQHFAAQPIVYSWNDVWEMNTKIPYWWHVTSQIWLVLLIGWKFASSNQKHYPDLGNDELSV